MMLPTELEEAEQKIEDEFWNNVEMLDEALISEQITEEEYERQYSMLEANKEVMLFELQKNNKE